MKTQSCEPCAKRKVRCDKQEPCSNCKRRKHDRCIYPEASSPYDRIKKLEAIIRNLGRDPDSDARLPSNPARAISSASAQQGGLPTLGSPEPAIGSADPVILEEDGQPFYLESRVGWHTWHGHNQQESVHQTTRIRNPFLARNNPHAFQAIFNSRGSFDVAAQYPPQEHAITLWDVFTHRVNPLVRLCFIWTLKQIHSASVYNPRQLNDAEHALMFSVYLISVISLSDEECDRDLQNSKSTLVSELQMLCEEALIRTNIFCITDIKVLQALTIYMMAGAERLSTQSLWSLMGLIIRNAEKLGIHRDGSLMGLPPVQVEERRRLWWQLQHLDLGQAIISGLTPLTLVADWDAKLPLNIEDDDMCASTTEPPKERKGTTNMSYCLYTYWILDQQRQFMRSGKDRLETNPQIKKSLPSALEDTLILQLEEGLNKQFLQYCDPIKPVDALLQISARSVICILRLRKLHPVGQGGSLDPPSKEHREALLSACIQSLEYNIALYAQPAIRRFVWWTKGMFPWQALMCVLVECSQQDDEAKTRRIWDLIAELYLHNFTLSRLSEDRRRSQAAGLVVSAWKARQKKLGSLQKPQFVIILESQLAQCNVADPSLPFNTEQMHQASSAQNQHQHQHQNHEPITPQSFSTGQDIDAIFDLDFRDIDWSFWNSMD